MALNFRSQKSNGILIKPYYGSFKNDKALYYLKDILVRIAEDKDIFDVREGLLKYKEEIMRNVTSSRAWK